MAQEWSDAQLKWYDRVNKSRPAHYSHNITTDDISQYLTKLMPNSWRLEGNRLIGQTDMGELVQIIPPEYILTGTDDKGLPQFQKVVLSK